MGAHAHAHQSVNNNKQTSTYSFSYFGLLALHALTFPQTPPPKPIQKITCFHFVQPEPSRNRSDLLRPPQSKSLWSSVKVGSMFLEESCRHTYTLQTYGTVKFCPATARCGNEERERGTGAFPFPGAQFTSVEFTHFSATPDMSSAPGVPRVFHRCTGSRVDSRGQLGDDVRVPANSHYHARSTCRRQYDRGGVASADGGAAYVWTTDGASARPRPLR